MKKSLLIITITIFLPAALVLSLGYFGDRKFEGGTKLPPVNLVVKSAKSLTGTPYDPLMGMYGNIGEKFGFMVCSDIPNIAYGLEGYSWKDVLKKDFEVNAKEYETSDGNNPSNPYFHRRARNIFSYFKSNNLLKSKNYLPSVGDLVFYTKSNNGYVAHITMVTEVNDGTYSVMESAPKTIFAQEVNENSPYERGWIFAGYGSVYKKPPALGPN